MQSRDLIRGNLTRSAERVLEHVEDMRGHSLVFPTPLGGCHTLWVLGHLAYIEAQVIQSFMLGQANPLAEWEPLFDRDEPSSQADRYPSFDHVLMTCRDTRRFTISRLEELEEADLDRVGAGVPQGWETTFGTYRLCFQFAADHWLMHRGHLADARRAAGLTRMWV